jgi:trigger factor
MDIKRVAINAVNEVIVLKVVHMDYKGQVQKRINEKMPLATVKGYRKGAVPKELVEKQYGRAIKIEEVKKVVDLALERYIQSERLNLLGTPLEKENSDFPWDNEELEFEYEIGLVPNFELDLDAKNDIIKYVVAADDKLIDEQVVRIQKQFGTPIPQTVIEESSEITGTFTNAEHGINAPYTFNISIFKDKKTGAKFIGKKAGDVVTVNTKGLFEDDHQLMDVLKVDHDKVHGLAIDVDFTTTNTLIQITVNRIHDRGNIRRYVFLKKAFIGFDVEGEGTNHAYIVLYMHDRNIRFELFNFSFFKIFSFSNFN